MIQRPPSSTRTDTLFPYTTLFRSVPFLVRLLQSLDGGLSTAEYSLFAAKAKNISDLDKVIEQIEAFRELDDAHRKEIVRLLDAYQIGGTKRGSLLTLVRLGRSYAIRMWQLYYLFAFGRASSEESVG